MGASAILFPVQLRWADMDVNHHMRHSVYYDLGAQARVVAIAAAGITLARMKEEGFGPILFREECLFKREIRMDHAVEVSVRLSRARPDGSRWTFSHEFIRNDGELCATLLVDGAWMDIARRKLTLPPKDLMDAFMQLPRTADFEMQAMSGAKTSDA